MSTADNPRICGAKRRNGEPCRNRPMANGRCKFHGGMSPVGMASGNFTHGRYSKLLPRDLATRYRRAVKDADLLVMSDEIALLDARLGELLGAVQSGGGGASWQMARDHFGAFVVAMRGGDTARVALAVEDLRRVLDGGVHAEENWQLVYEVIEQRRRLVETEQRRRLAAGTMLKAEEAQVLIAALLEAVRDNVSDRDTRAAIGREFARLTGVYHSEPTRPPIPAATVEPEPDDTADR